MARLNVRKRSNRGLAHKRQVNELVAAIESLAIGTADGLGPDGARSQGFVVAIVSAAVSGQRGKFLGKSLDVGKARPEATGDLAAGQIGVPSAGDDVVIWYAPAINDEDAELEEGDVVGGFAIDTDANGRMVVLVMSGGGDDPELPPGVHFAVQLECVNDVDGQGDANTPVSYLYIVRDLYGTVLDDTNVSGNELGPKWGRPPGVMIPATDGAAYYDENGDLQLAIAYEIPGTGPGLCGVESGGGE